MEFLEAHLCSNISSYNMQRSVPIVCFFTCGGKINVERKQSICMSFQWMQNGKEVWHEADPQNALCWLLWWTHQIKGWSGSDWENAGIGGETWWIFLMQKKSGRWAHDDLCSIFSVQCYPPEEGTEPAGGRELYTHSEQFLNECKQQDDEEQWRRRPPKVVCRKIMVRAD